MKLKAKPDFPLVWDSTMRGSFVACPRKFYYEFMQRLAPSAVSIHLHFGGAFAAGLEEARREYYSRSHDTERALGAGVRGILTHWGDYEIEDEDPTPKTLENCLLAFDAYVSNWPFMSDYIQPYMAATGPAVEYTFGLPLEDVRHPVTGEPLIYAGRFDLLGVYNTMLWVVDEKTTTRLGPTWTGQWPLRSQFMGYCWAAGEYGQPVAGAVVRGTAIKKYCFDFAESIIPLQQWKIDRWREQLSCDLNRAIQAWKAGYWDYDLDSACNSYSGCTFKRLCESPNPERWIDGYYVERFWNPLASDPTAPTKDADKIYTNG